MLAGFNRLGTALLLFRTLEQRTSMNTDQQTTVATLKHWMAEFVREREWERFHNGKNLAMSLTIEAGELMEHFQWLTTDEVVAGQGLDRQGIEDELADVLCYALSLANALGIDITAAIEQKMVKNRLKYPCERPST